MLRHFVLCFVLLGFIGGLACFSDEKDNTNSSSNREKTTGDENASKTPPWGAIQKGDFDAMQKRGTIRLILPKKLEFSYLPRMGLPQSHERKLALRFIKEQGLTPVELFVDSRADMIPYLNQGKGDIIVAGLSITENRKKSIDFSVPLWAVNEQVVVRVDETYIQSLSDLRGRSIAVRKSSSYWETITELKKEHPYLNLVPVDETMDTLQIMGAVASGEYDLTIADDNLVSVFQSYNDSLRVAFDLPKEQTVAWAFRKNSPELKFELDTFLSKANPSVGMQEMEQVDWAEIKKRKLLRVLTRNSAATYFIWRGELLGFEYDLIRHFAERHNLRVELVVPPHRSDLIPWLRKGKGDIIAASLTASDERAKREKIVFSRPYNFASEIVVARKSEEEAGTLPKTKEDLAGRTIVVRPSSSYWKTLETLQNNGIALKLVEAPEEMETEEIIAKVAEGTYDLTVSDSHILDVELTWRDDVTAAFALGDPVPHGWAVRKNSKDLLDKVNRYIRKEYKGVFYNLTRKRYFSNKEKILKHKEFRAKTKGQLSPYDDIVKGFAEQYGFDWRLIVAQMYQESQFNPQARSFAGALGLMQVMPRTAKFLGYDNLTRPLEGIQAGVAYLHYLKQYFPDDLPVEDRTWFLLASYNVGQGHVFDARRLAKALKLNPNRWFGNVEKAMLLLSNPRYARHARYGYCRGSEPVRYVSEIRRRFEGYKKAAQP